MWRCFPRDDADRPHLTPGPSATRILPIDLDRQPGVEFRALIQGVGAAWMMTAISDSAGMVALVQASTALPIMLLSLPSGAIADNFDRRKVMLIGAVLHAAVSVGLTIAAYRRADAMAWPPAALHS